MPSFNVIDAEGAVTIDAYIYAFRNGVHYQIGGGGGTVLINLENGAKYDLGVNRTKTGSVKLINYKLATKSTVVLRILYIPSSGIIRVADVEVDIDAKTANETVVKDLSLSWADDSTDYVVLPPRLLICRETDSGVIHYVDLEDGSEVNFDTGFGSYFPRTSWKIVPRKDDLYMLLGKHLAGDNFRALKIYSQSVVDLGFNTGGGSPRPLIGGICNFNDEFLVLASSGGVNDADNDLKILDSAFNVKATIDLAGIAGYGNASCYGGFHIIAKKTDGGYYALAYIDQPTGGDAPLSLWWLELDNTFAVVSKQQIYSASGKEPHANIFSESSGHHASPLIDLARKKIYMPLYHYVEASSSHVRKIVQIDVSDVWDNIAEFNKVNWFMPQLKIPTTLTLNVTPL